MIVCTSIGIRGDLDLCLIVLLLTYKYTSFKLLALFGYLSLFILIDRRALFRTY